MLKAFLLSVIVRRINGEGASSLFGCQLVKVCLVRESKTPDESLTRERSDDRKTLSPCFNEDKQGNDEPENSAVMPRCDYHALSILDMIPRKLTCWQQYPQDSSWNSKNGNLTWWQKSWTTRRIWCIRIKRICAGICPREERWRNQNK